MAKGEPEDHDYVNQMSRIKKMICSSPWDLILHDEGNDSKVEGKCEIFLLYLFGTGGGPTLFTLLAWTNEITATRLTGFNTQDFTLKGHFKYPNIQTFAVLWVRKESSRRGKGKISVSVSKKGNTLYSVCTVSVQSGQTFFIIIIFSILYMYDIKTMK